MKYQGLPSIFGFVAVSLRSMVVLSRTALLGYMPSIAIRLAGTNLAFIISSF